MYSKDYPRSLVCTCTDYMRLESWENVIPIFHEIIDINKKKWFSWFVGTSPPAPMLVAGFGRRGRATTATFVALDVVHRAA